MRIQNKNTCSWDTSFTIQPYPKSPVSLSINIVNPVCSKLNSGSAVIDIKGDQAPYWLAFNSTTYSSGSLIDQLGVGSYSFPVINQDGCVVDTAKLTLQLDLLPECNTIYLPSAFSPNGSGTNDLFRIIHSSPYLKKIKLQVYNRSGMVLFTSSAAQQGWDGTFHGVPQAPGTYVWTVSYIDFENTKKETHGTVLLLR